MLQIAIIVFILSLLDRIASVEVAINGISSSIDGVEFIYQTPLSPRGIVFLAHGCSHSATDWFPASTSCPNCIGLPVEQSIVSFGLERNYLMVAASSLNRDHKCWMKKDVSRVATVIQHIYNTVLLSDFSKPLHLLGASSGGRFVAMFSKYDLGKLHVSSLCVQIMAAPSDMPTLYIAMERDMYTLRSIEGQIEHSERQEVKLAKIKKIDERYFYDHGVLKLSESTAVFNSFLKFKIISGDYYLIEDPRNSAWRKAVLDALPQIREKDNLIADESGISELLNVAWAGHEITDEFNKETYDFFEKHTNTKDNSQVRQDKELL